MKDYGLTFYSTSLAAGKRRTTQTLVMKIGIHIKALQPPSHWNLTTQPVVADVQVLEIQCGQLHRKLTVDFVMAQI